MTRRARPPRTSGAGPGRARPHPGPSASTDLVMGGILSAYDGINRRSRPAIPDAALKSLAALRDSLDREPAASLPAIRDRRPVELFIIGSLEELIRNRADSNRGDVAALIAATTRIAALRDKAAQAERLYQQKDYAGAKEALPLGPGRNTRGQNRRREAGLPVLLDAQAELAATRRSGQDFIAQGTGFARDGQWQAALDRYRTALGLLLGDGVAADALVAQVAEAGLRLGAAAEPPRASLVSDRIESLKAEILRQGVDPGAGAGAIQGEDLTALLQAKLLLWQIIGSDPIKTTYPDLYETMQKYFDTFASQQRQAGQGRRAARRHSAHRVVEERRGFRRSNPRSGFCSSPAAILATDRGSMIKLLDGLEGLLQK